MTNAALANGPSFLDQVHDAVITTDLNGAIAGWNAGAERVYGYSAPETLGHSISILYFPEDVHTLESLVLAPLKTRELNEVMLRNRRKGGEEIFIDLRISILRDETGNAVGYVGCSNDVTERRRAEEAVSRTNSELESRVRERTQELKAANARLEVEVAERTRAESDLRSERTRLSHLVANTPGVFYTCSYSFPFEPVFISGNVEVVFGYTAAELTAEPDFWLSRVHPDDVDRVISETTQLGERGTTIQEYRFQFRDGSYEWIRDSAAVARGLSGEALEIVGYCENITDSKRAGEALREREIHTAMEQALLTTQESERRRISRDLHDNLNQDLAALMVDIACLERNIGRSNGSLRQRLKSFHSRVSEISESVHQIAAQLHPARLEKLGLQVALEADCSALSKRAGIEIAFNCGLTATQLQPDTALCLYRIGQECLANIARHAKTSRAEVTLERAAHGVKLSVQDFGAGFDPAAVPAGRLGLLSMAERARLAGGTFSLHSVIGQGTRIQVWIPGEVS